MRGNVVNRLIKIVHDSDQIPEAGLSALIDKAAEYTAKREGLLSFDCEVSLFFASKSEIRRLNAAYRGMDNPTDVLSFPMFELPLKEPPLDEAPVLLGDVVISSEIAEEQAKEYGHSKEREVLYLFVHGLLHLLGYEHEGEGTEAMRLAEEEILSLLGLERQQQEK